MNGFAKKLYLTFLCAFLVFSGKVYAVEKFALMTIPKSGTFLLNKLFISEAFGNLMRTNSLQTFELPEHYLITHFLFGSPSLCFEPYLRTMPTKIILNFRDLRAVALSMVEFWTDLSILPFVTEGMNDSGQWLRLSTKEKLEALFMPELWGKSLLLAECEVIRKWIPLFDNDNVYVTTFEKMVGPKGGGNLEVQEQEITNIAKFLGVSLDQDQLDAITSTLFGSSLTFSHGQIDRWKEYFDENLLKLVEEHVGDLQSFFGYGCKH